MSCGAEFAYGVVLGIAGATIVAMVLALLRRSPQSSPHSYPDDYEPYDPLH